MYVRNLLKTAEDKVRDITLIIVCSDSFLGDYTVSPKKCSHFYFSNNSVNN